MARRAARRCPGTRPLLLPELERIHPRRAPRQKPRERRPHWPTGASPRATGLCLGATVPRPPRRPGRSAPTARAAPRLPSHMPRGAKKPPAPASRSRCTRPGATPCRG
eukprot:2162461-Alexandrium_andersonii.AAC.1